MARSKTQSRTLEGVDAEMEPATAAEAAQDQTLGGGDPTRRPWPDLCVTLFNEATRASLRPKSIALRLRIDGETSDLIRPANDHGRYTIPGDQIQRLIGELTDIGVVDRVFAEVELAEPCDIEFVRYMGLPVRFELARGSDCGCIPIPLLSVDETCTLRFRAFDCRYTDYLENGEALLNNVGVTVTPVSVASPSSQLTRNVRTQVLRATTNRGLAELTGLQRHQLYARSLRRKDT